MFNDSSGGHILFCVVCHYVPNNAAPEEPADYIIYGLSCCAVHLWAVRYGRGNLETTLRCARGEK